MTPLDISLFIRNTTIYYSIYINNDGKEKITTHYISLETRNAMADTILKLIKESDEI